MNGYAIFTDNDGSETKLSWEELQLKENAEKYDYDLPIVGKGKDKDKIVNHAFCGCWSLKEVCIPQGISQLGYESFNNCPYLEKAILPRTIAKSLDAFWDCDGLKKIIAPLGLGLGISSKKVERTNEIYPPLQEFYDRCEKDGITISQYEKDNFNKWKSIHRVYDRFKDVLGLKNEDGERLFNLVEISNFLDSEFQKEISDSNRGCNEIKEIVKISKKLGIEPTLDKSADELKNMYILKLEGDLKKLGEEYNKQKEKELRHDHSPVHERE